MPQFNLSQIQKKIDNALLDAKNPTAVFDADGTLWNNDVGFGFFNYQINNQLLANLNKDSFRKHESQYNNLNTRHKALLWLAQINKGVKLSTLRSWIKDYIKSISPMAFIPEQMQLIKYLQKKHIKIFVVTASLKWIIEEATRDLGIPMENCIGVCTKIQNKVVTDIQSGEITWGDKKLIEFLKHSNGVNPLLASGNSMGDLSLLENASCVSLAVSKSNKCDELDEHYAAEKQLLDIALKKDWFCLE